MEVVTTRISIDGKNYDVKPKKNLLETCLALGFNIPHFCYHPALGSVGACRLCAVKKFKDKDDKKGRIIMSCMEPVTEGLLISTEDVEVKAFRAAVIESLMTNHPHDCPVCDEGGECHLQDMTVMTGHNYRRFDFNKRTYRNQNLGPFINHEMNRCIHCYRCVRFYKDYAGGKDLDVFSSRNHVYFGRHEDGILESEFSGNLIEVCPTGVFTDKTLKNHYTRKWDLTNAPSVCVHCSLGCNIIISERYNYLRRVMSRYNGAVNGYFLCDRGRFGYEFVNSEKRIRKTQIRDHKKSNLKEVDDELLLLSLDTLLLNKNKIIGIGSPRASIESNYALSVLVGKENFYHGISTKEQLLTKTILDFFQSGSIIIPSLKQIEKADAVLILGEDITNTAPMIALALRQAARNVPGEAADNICIPLWNDSPVRELAQNIKSPVYIATPFKGALDDIAEGTFRGSGDATATLGLAITSEIIGIAPKVKINIKEDQHLAEKIAFSLKNAKNPLIISGVTCGDENIINTALKIATALLSSERNVMLSIVLPECNSMGLALIPGKPLDDLFALPDSQVIETLVILENDLFRRANHETVTHLFNRARNIIVIDNLLNNTSSKADILLPAATFAESEGTLVNNEGRAQRFYKAIVNKDQVKASWRWINDLIRIKNNRLTGPWSRFEDVVSSLIIDFPLFSKMKLYVPENDLRMINAKIPRQTIRRSGRTAINAHLSVSESGVPDDSDSPFAFSMEGIEESPPSAFVPYYWTPGWNSVQALYFYLDEPNGSMKGGDPGIILIGNDKSRTSTNVNNKHQHQLTKLQVDELLIVPVFQIFGSEELSSSGTAIYQRINEPFVYLNQKDADSLDVADNDYIQLTISDNKLKIKVKIEDSIQSRIAGLYLNLTTMNFIDLPATGKFNKI